MSYAKRLLDRMSNLDLDWHPPFIVGLRFQEIAIQLDESETFNPTAAEEIERCLYAIAKKLPDTYKPSRAEFIKTAEAWLDNRDVYSSQPSVPLHDLLPVAECILLLHAHFCHGPIRDFGLFPELRRQLFLNQASYHRMSLVDIQRYKAPPVTDIKEEPKALIDKFLGGTIFHKLFYCEVPFTISKKALSEHCFIAAKPGHGKTVLLSSFAAQFLTDPKQPGLFCLDPAGDWFEKLRDRVPPERLVVLDPETNPPPLNFFDFRNTSVAAERSFGYLMSSLSGGLSDKQGAIVPYLLKLLRLIPEASLETLRLIVDEKVKTPDKSQFAPAIRALPLVDQGFFHNQFYHSSMDMTKQAMAWKIYSAMSSDAFRTMFGATENSFDAHAAMRDGKVVLVRGSELTLGEDGQSVFLQYVVSQFFLAALARSHVPEHKRRQCYLLCDEAKHIYNHQIERILTECRKWGLSFFSATQVIDQIPTEVKAAIYGATAIKAAGNVSFSDASMLAREMRTQPDVIQSMKTFEWAIYVADSDKAVKVRVPPGALEALQKHHAPPPKKQEGPVYQVTEPSRNIQVVPAKADTPNPTTSPPKQKPGKGRGL